MILVPVAREAFFPFLMVSFLAGIVFGAVYDLFRIRRVAFRLPSHADPEAGGFGKHLMRVDTVLTGIEDIVFVAFAAIVLILITFKLYFGVPRWFAYAAALGGFALYHVTVGRLVIRSAETIIGCFRYLGNLIKRRLLSPLGQRLMSLCRGGVRFWRRHADRRYTRKQEAYMLTVVGEVSLPPNRKSRNGGKDDACE